MTTPTQISIAALINFELKGKQAIWLHNGNTCKGIILAITGNIAVVEQLKTKNVYKLDTTKTILNIQPALYKNAQFN